MVRKRTLRRHMYVSRRLVQRPELLFHDQQDPEILLQ
jgi:hypothetical protein